MIEERPSYDTTQFIADVGGSLGFLLGLSVLGLIGILEHVKCILNCMPTLTYASFFFFVIFR